MVLQAITSCVQVPSTTDLEMDFINVVNDILVG